jgi:hypothetical protein
MLISGLWRGHYEQGGSRHAQEMVLEFADGLVRGDGKDGIGRFTIEGEYRVADDDIRLGWIKTYDGAHSVLYLGTLAASGVVGGEWRIGRIRGGFELQIDRSREMTA